MDNLEFRDALSGHCLNGPVPAFIQFGQFIRHPPVTLAENADEEWPIGVNLVEAEIENAIIVGLLFGHTPAQVNVHQMNVMRFQAGAQLRESDLDQIVPLGIHVAEGRGDKYTSGFPSRSHWVFPFKDGGSVVCLG